MCVHVYIYVYVVRVDLYRMRRGGKGDGFLSSSRGDSMPLERSIIHSLAAHYNLKRLLSVLPVIPYELSRQGPCHLSRLLAERALPLVSPEMSSPLLTLYY